MSVFTRWKAWSAAALAMMGALALTACMVTPGRFDATLDLRRDGRFSFDYNGEIYILALSNLTEMAERAESESAAFEPDTCWDEDTYEERECTEEEIAEQRETWESWQESRLAEKKQEAEAMQTMLGGIDPSDPEAAEELAAMLRRQKGWNKVEYRGDGLFDVEFSISSRMGHDFAFPTFEHFPISNSFVSANLRQGDIVRVEAPGFAAQGGSNPMAGMMAGMAGMFAGMSDEAAQDGETPPDMPVIEGAFRILTDGDILANNTDEGPQAGENGQELAWNINTRTTTAPMALIRIGQ
ncbi:hypothetical protein FHS61_002561 [Altererythrobacter atlanticus]|uniref:Uncharacterized protein n=1 Tax=Croceibacterium atlanticum TaxID=1267766 RepID=A0A0F7KT08_9SPHN|nr:hypothetical protein [Croceibacterium atlanticum]AKH41910.1 hypothetical protein WYH_00859 [Croceibacterium atlanticum]MBB5733526.1 hypothetical protein [Croceibacterium atlanticum]